GDVVADGGAEEDDAVLEELGVGVDAADAVRRALLPLRDVVVHARADLGAHGGQVLHFEVRAGRPSSAASRGLVITWSMKPYSLAASAVNHRSRSESRSICSSVWPVCSAMSSCMTFLMCSDCSAWILMSEAEPPMPPEGWCIMIRACGRE